MKNTLLTYVIPFLLLGLGNSALSHSSQSIEHNKFTAFQEDLWCYGSHCSSSQYCDWSLDPERCVYKLKLGEVCTAIGQCDTSNGECLSKNGAMSCECVDKFVASNGQCVPQCSQDDQCSSGSYCNSELKGCLPQIDLNRPCNSADGERQCKTANTTCIEATCQCDPTFIENEGVCISKCNDTSCSSIQFCDAGLCKSKLDLGEVCESSKQCLRTNSECCISNSTCQCSVGYTPYLGSCLLSCVSSANCKIDFYCDTRNKICVNKSPLHQGCAEAEGSCLDANSNCIAVEGRQLTCECKETFVDKGSICAPKCTSNNNCTTKEYCNTHSGLCDPRRLLGQSCSTQAANECSEGHSECSGAPLKCTCMADYTQSGDKCVIKCTSNWECSDPNFYCNNDFGICSPRISLNGYCDKRDGNPCKTDMSSCQGNPSMCTCNSAYVEDKPTSKCIPRCTYTNCPSDQFCNTYTDSCMDKIDLQGQCFDKNRVGECKASNSECQQQNSTDPTNFTCVCSNGYVQKGNSCVLKCQRSSDCEGENEFCETKTGLCWKKAELGQECSNADQCSSPYAECPDSNNICTCNPNYVQWSSICIERCTNTSVCSNGEYCQEREGVCYKKVGLHRTCTEDTHCSTPSAICKYPASTSGIRTCECDSGTIDKGTYCILGCSRTSICNFNLEYCDTISSKCINRVSLHGKCIEEGFDQCLGPLSTCGGQGSNNMTCECIKDTVETADKLKCSCPKGLVVSLDSRRCLKSASNLGESCEEATQCVNLGYGGSETTACTSNVCNCTSSSIEFDGLCFMQKNIGASCADKKECTVGIDGDVNCDPTSNTCKCNTGFRPSSDGLSCLKDSGGSGGGGSGGDSGSGAFDLFKINIFLIVSSLAFFKYSL